MDHFQFDLGAKVKLLSGERGTIIGRGEYVNSEDTYFVRYVAADGRLVEAWWQESAIAGLVEQEA